MPALMLTAEAKREQIVALALLQIVAIGCDSIYRLIYRES
jgi:hypothetical protein